MLLSPRKNGLTSLFKEVRDFKVCDSLWTRKNLKGAKGGGVQTGGSRSGLFLVNLFLTKLVRISGFSSLFSAIAMFLYPLTNVLKNTAIAEKREENPEILTNLVRKRLTRVLPSLSFFVLFGAFLIFWGLCPISPSFLFLGLLILLKAPTRNRPERVRDTIRTFPKKVGKLRFGNPG